MFEQGKHPLPPQKKTLPLKKDIPYPPQKNFKKSVDKCLYRCYNVIRKKEKRYKKMTTNTTTTTNNNTTKNTTTTTTTNNGKVFRAKRYYATRPQNTIRLFH